MRVALLLDYGAVLLPKMEDLDICVLDVALLLILFDINGSMIIILQLEVVC